MWQNKKKIKITPSTVTSEEYYFQNICCSGAIYNHNTVVSSKFIECQLSGIWLTSWSMNGMLLWISNQALYWLHHCPWVCLALNPWKLMPSNIDDATVHHYWYMPCGKTCSSLTEATVDFKLVKGKCQVTYSENLRSLEEYFCGGLDRFYFTEVRFCLRGPFLR